MSAKQKRVLKWIFMGIGLLIPIAVSFAIRLQKNDKPLIAVISNCAVNFWTIARSGTNASRRSFDVDAEFYMPAFASAAEQHRIIEDLVIRGVKGIAISPADAANQTRVLNRIIPDNVYLITQDSDLYGDSKRKCYIGTDNAKAGWRVGQLVKEVIPEGGKIILYATKLDVTALRDRRQGVIAALAGLSEEQCKGERAEKLSNDPYPLILGKYSLLDTMSDNADKEKCYANVVDSLVKHPDINCLVGLWTAAPPAMLLGVRRLHKEAKIKLVGFDEDEITLRGIKNGAIHATVVQDPYLFGYESIHILNNFIKMGSLPGQMPKTVQLENLVNGPHYFVAPRIIKSKNDGGLYDMDVDTFSVDLKRKQG